MIMSGGRTWIQRFLFFMLHQFYGFIILNLKFFLLCSYDFWQELLIRDMQEAEGLARELEAKEQLNSLGYIDVPCKNIGEGGSSQILPQTPTTNTKKSLDFGTGDKLP